MVSAVRDASHCLATSTAIPVTVLAAVVTDHHQIFLYGWVPRATKTGVLAATMSRLRLLRVIPMRAKKGMGSGGKIGHPVSSRDMLSVSVGRIWGSSEPWARQSTVGRGFVLEPFRFLGDFFYVLLNQVRTVLVGENRLSAPDEIGFVSKNFGLAHEQDPIPGCQRRVPVWDDQLVVTIDRGHQPSGGMDIFQRHADGRTAGKHRDLAEFACAESKSDAQGVGSTQSVAHMKSEDLFDQDDIGLL